MSKRLSQDAIRRMIGDRVGSGGGGGGSLDPAALAGMASQAWVEEGYISKAFWNELLIIHKKVTTVVMNGETEVSRTVTTNTVFEPNEVPSETSTTDPTTGYVTTVTTEVDNIQAKKGVWTNFFLSALGKNDSGGGGGGSTTLAGLLDVELTTPISNGQALIYNSTLGKWVNGAAGMSQADADLRYLKLAGGTLTGNLAIRGTYDLYQSDNGVSSIAYPGYRIYDINGNIASQYIGIVNPNGYNGFWIGARNYDTEGTMVADKGIGLAINKNGEGYWTVHEPASFRTAIGILSTTENDARYLKLSNSGIIDGHKVKLNGIDVEVPVAYNIPTTGSFTSGYWHKLGDYVTAGDGANLVLEIYDGNGYNSQAEQNSLLRVVIKDGWQSSRQAIDSVGTTIERFGYWTANMEIRIVATAHNAGAVWIYLPWQYAQGTYEVSGQYTSWTHNSSTSSDTTTEPVTNQTKNSTNDHSYIYLDNAYTNSNVASATKLQTARLIWGNSFNGTANVNGDINMESGTYIKFKIGNDYTSALGVWGTGYDLLNIGYYTTLDKSYATNIYGNILRLYGSSSNLGILINTDGNVGVGISTPSYKLDVNGTINCTSIRIGGYTITADSSNGALRINSAGLYADTYISALGSNSGGGGGGVTLSEPLYSINNAGLGSPTGSGKTIVWNGTQWTYGTISSGTITSVGMTVPTGFSVNPSSIQSSGTFAISFASGYSLPTTAKQSNWDTAYNNNHQHSNKSVLDGITQVMVTKWNACVDSGEVTTQLQNYAYISSGVIHIGDTSITPLTSDSGTFWGQSWQSGGTVSGNMSSVGNITTSSHGSNYIEGFRTIELYGAAAAGYGGYIDFHFNDDSYDFTSRIIEDASGRIYLNASNGVRIGNGVLKWDSDNNALKVEKYDGTTANFYATGGVSALGVGTGGSVTNLAISGKISFSDNYEIKVNAGDMYIGDSTSEQYVKVSDICSWNGSSNWYITTNGVARFQRIYLDSSRYIYVSSGTLYYYNGSTAKEIALV